MNKRALGGLLLLFGIIDTFFSHQLIELATNGIGETDQLFMMVEWVIRAIGIVMLVFGLRFIFTEETEQQTEIIPEPRDIQIEKMFNKLQQEQQEPIDKNNLYEPLIKQLTKNFRGLQDLDKEQREYIQGISIAALVNPLVWVIANHFWITIPLMFIPIVNIITWLILIFKGRHLAWSISKVGFEKFQARQRTTLLIGVITTGTLVALGIYGNF